MLTKTLGLVFFFLIIINFSQTHASEIKTYAFTVPTKYGDQHIRIHAYQQNEKLVEMIKSYARKRVPKIVEYFGYRTTKPVNVSLEDEKLNSNGFATPFPRNYMTLFSMQPLGSGYLSSSLNYYEKLFIHEFIHSIHLDYTDGYVEVIGWVFGRLANIIPAITPRWFPEGIAMWGEDRFTDEGRLRNPLLVRETEYLLARAEVCNNIACMADPGVHPYGSLAYWFGGMFFKFIEQKMPGTIACLVKSNGRSIPFTLRYRFRQCTDRDEEEWFAYFKSSLNSNKIPPVKFQRGLFFDGENLFYIKEDFRRNYLVKKNMKTNEEKLIDLEVAVVSILPSKDKMRLIAYSSFSDNPDHEVYEYKDGNLELVSSGNHYSFKVQDTEVTLNFKQKKWSFSKNEKVFYELSDFSTLLNPYIEDKAIHFSSFNMDESYHLKSVDLGGKSKTFKIGRPFSWLGLCDDGAYYRLNKNHYFRYHKGQVEFLKSNIDLKFLAGKKSSLVYYDDGFVTSPQQCRRLFKKGERPNNTSGYPRNVTSTDKSYSPLKHLVPTWWWFSAQSSQEDTLGYFSVMTAMADPLQRHSVSVDVTKYYREDVIGGEFSYVYSPNNSGSFSSKALSVGVQTSKTFSSNSYSDSPDFEESVGVFVQKSKTFSKVKASVGLLGQKSRVKEYFGNYKIEQFQAYFSLLKFQEYKYQFFNNFSLQLSAGEVDNKIHKKYKSYSGSTMATFDFYRDFNLRLKVSYDLLDKDIYSGGTNYGGGQGFSDHDFYGLDYSDAFGNEMLSYRAKFKMPLFYLYHGWGFTFLYVKRLNAILGMDYLKSDYIVYDSQLNFKRSITSSYYGFSASLDLFYNVPIEYEAIWINTKLKDGKSKSSFNFMVKAGVEF